MYLLLRLLDLYFNFMYFYIYFNCYNHLLLLLLLLLLFSFDDIECLANSTSLNELSLDGNPFATHSNYKQSVLRNLSSLRQLDMKRISVRVVFISCCTDTVLCHRCRCTCNLQTKHESDILD